MTQFSGFSAVAVVFLGRVLPRGGSQDYFTSVYIHIMNIGHATGLGIPLPTLGM